MRFSLWRRIRAHVGVRAARIQPRLGQHAVVLGPDGAGHRRWGADIQFRPLHPGQRHTSLQDAVGRPGAAAVVVRRLETRRGNDSLPKRRRVPLGSAAVAVSADSGRQGTRPRYRSVHPVIWRRVPPVVSPIAARSVFDAGRAALRVRHVRPDALATDIARMFGADECILTDSGTSALVLALRMAVPTGELVSLPGYVCIDVTAAAQRAGVRVMLYDIHPETLSPDLDSVSRTIAAGT